MGVSSSRAKHKNKKDSALLSYKCAYVTHGDPGVHAESSVSTSPSVLVSSVLKMLKVKLKTNLVIEIICLSRLPGAL